ncbi:hypothetical protein HDE_01517 [Halotydeus destructor]|nr:hypothetical protein HDE_01517 [Halotydeus destructor]
MAGNAPSKDDVPNHDFDENMFWITRCIRYMKRLNSRAEQLQRPRQPKMLEFKSGEHRIGIVVFIPKTNNPRTWIAHLLRPNLRDPAVYAGEGLSFTAVPDHNFNGVTITVQQFFDVITKYMVHILSNPHPSLHTCYFYFKRGWAMVAPLKMPDDYHFFSVAEDPTMAIIKCIYNVLDKVGFDYADCCCDDWDQRLRYKLEQDICSVQAPRNLSRFEDWSQAGRGPAPSDLRYPWCTPRRLKQEPQD